jgi:hypothetical protein
MALVVLSVVMPGSWRAIAGVPTCSLDLRSRRLPCLRLQSAVLPVPREGNP